MNIDQVMQIYREAVEPTATAAEGLDWWREVQAEGFCRVGGAAGVLSH